MEFSFTLSARVLGLGLFGSGSFSASSSSSVFFGGRHSNFMVTCGVNVFLLQASGCQVFFCFNGPSFVQDEKFGLS